ncbi:uncharacterized protein J4E79_010795 [Alternaria viburni]|uniref:uncharacterized protein n=1 Tax=Alternaria viburni TaxID=566460 RepID=UPI0020C4F20E|nr:uncharacterized protein J4E79_010795 [Alternaria viburni]KAI4645617.1 hypothetical protein J4E79_010795 [Alternaria viburni]
MAQPMVTASHEGHGGVPAPFLPQLQSPLLRLPGELRNKIYEYALEDSKPPQLSDAIQDPRSTITFVQ